MLVQRLGPLEASRAQVALVAQVTGVSLVVENHFPLVPETLAAHWTLERRLPGVEANVDVVPLLVKVLPGAELTREGRVHFVSLLVHKKVRLVLALFATHIAHERRRL